MSPRSAEKAVVVSALVVAIIYTYRVVTEGHSTGPSGGAKQLLGAGAPPNVGRFITGWGFSFLVLAIIAEAAPPLGGWLAILTATGDALANMGQVAADINKKVTGPAGTAGAAKSIAAGTQAAAIDSAAAAINQGTARHSAATGLSVGSAGAAITSGVSAR